MKLYPLSRLLCHENESLRLEGVRFTAPSHGTILKAPGATRSPRGEEGAFQRRAAAAGAIVPHLPSTSSPCPSQPSAVPARPSCPPPHLSRTRVPCPTRSPPRGSSRTLPLPLTPREGRTKLPPLGPQMDPGGEKEGLWGGACSPPCEGRRGAGGCRCPQPSRGLDLLTEETGSSPGWDQDNLRKLQHRQCVCSYREQTHQTPRLLKTGCPSHPSHCVTSPALGSSM